MSIRISMTPNLIAKDGTAIPRLIGVGRANFNRVLDYMTRGTALNRDDMEVVFARFADALAFFIDQGRKVETPIGDFSPAIRAGAMPRYALPSDIPKSALRINFSVNQPLIKSIRKQAEFEIDDNYKPREPRIYGYSPADREDWMHEALDQPALLNLYGWDLSFDPKDDEQGLFLQNPDADGPAYRISVYSRIGSNHIDFLIKNVPPGEYTIRLVRRNQRGTLQKSNFAENITLNA